MVVIFSDVLNVAKLLKDACDGVFEVCVWTIVVFPAGITAWFAIELFKKVGLVLEICSWTAVSFPDVGDWYVVKLLKGAFDNKLEVRVFDGTVVTFPETVTGWNVVEPLEGCCDEEYTVIVCAWTVFNCTEEVAACSVVAALEGGCEGIYWLYAAVLCVWMEVTFAVFVDCNIEDPLKSVCDDVCEVEVSAGIVIACLENVVVSNALLVGDCGDGFAVKFCE